MDKMYGTTLSQVFSPCGNYLAAGNNFGEIVIFDVQEILKGGGVDGECKSSCKFTTPNKEQVCSMASTGNFLVTGTVGEIFGWCWTSVTESKPKVSWSIPIPSGKDRMEPTDVNSLRIADKGHSTHLYAGCGDNNIYIFDMEDGKLVRTMEGHLDYIHSIDSLGDRLVSGGEDGNVILWDMRQTALTSIIKPFKNERIARPFTGKWIGDVCLSQDWMVCGGGPRLSLWHLRSLELMAVFTEIEDNGIHVSKFKEESVLVGGRSSHFYHCNYTGDVLSKLDTSSTTIYSAAFSSGPKEMLSLGGSSCYLDICTNLKFRHQVLTFA